MFNGLEWVSLKVKGQSFMFHQIRKMVGLTVAIMRTGANPDTLLNCFAPEKKHVPLVPGSGLFLETVSYPLSVFPWLWSCVTSVSSSSSFQVCYDHYNSRQVREKRETLDFAAEQLAVNAFKESHIFPQVMASEEKNKQYAV